MPTKTQTLIFLSTLLLLSTHSSSQPNQRQLLLTFKTSIKTSNNELFNTWNEQNPICNFSGIVCNSNNNVKEINLLDQQLAGTLSFDSLCALESLDTISLGSNLLYGTISTSLSNCTNLHHLDLGKNFFSGEVPDLSSLTRLTFLNLNDSGFRGKFPWKSVTNLTSLSFLSLGDNFFDEIPFFPLEVLNLQNLYYLYLSNSSISGKIPEGIGNLTLLERLEMADNRLVGAIPIGITRLSKLRMLELYSNRLSGTLPVGLGNLENLEMFDVSNNCLEGDLSELRNLTRMESLQLFGNSFSGTIPEEFGEFKYLKQFSIYDNRFTGELPQKIGSWAEFEYIDVSNNYLTGSIPPDMCKMGRIEKILMIDNNFTGELPMNYASCSSLLRLRVSNNSLSGRVPDGIWSLPKISMIDLAMNRFEGHLDPNIGEAVSLTQLFLANNRFSGALPMEISNVSTLVEIDLSSNRFSGGIPSRIGDLKKLSNLYLQDNMFSGAVPESLGLCASLNEINIARNSLSGPIPASLGSLASLNSLNLSGNKLSGVIPASLSLLKLTLIDLSNNMLIGRVPQPLLLVAYNGSFAGNPGLCADGSRDLRKCSRVSHKSNRLKVVLYGFIAGALVLLLLLSYYVFVKLRKINRENPINRGYSWEVKQFHVLKIEEEEIVRSLKEENIIGRGGSGNVYKVVLECGERLAVKHIQKSEPELCNWRDRNSCEVSPKEKTRWREYEAEVATLSSLRHVNVVKLYCSISSEVSNLLVYEYMPNGSLWDMLHTHQKIDMDWRVRYEIAVGAARGLEYLHHACERPVIHRDVKSSNILLDEDMKPKIADFGLAKIVQTGKVITESTHVIAGTHGYIAPEYGYTCHVTEKSDVYSFGVVLMELVTGKKPVEPEFGENKDIVYWVHNEMKTKEDVTVLVDPSISKDAKEVVVMMLSIAVRCTMKLPTLRPSMRMVVKMLEEMEPNTLTVVGTDLHLVKTEKEIQ